MSNLVIAIIILLVQGVLLAASLAALVMLAAPLAVKVLIVGFALLLVGISLELSFIRKLHERSVYFSRVNYIANEMARIAPEDLRHARDILRIDLRQEAEDESLRREASGGDIGPWLTALATILALCGAAYLTKVWPVIEAALSTVRS